MAIPIGLAGLKGSGKDTAFGFIQEWAAERGVSARRRSFADALKFSFARIFLPDCSIDEAVIWCDEIKFTGDLFIEWSNTSENGTKTTIEHRISGRIALQRYGTEGHRDVFGDNFWVDVLLPETSTLIETRPPTREELTIDAYYEKALGTKEPEGAPMMPPGYREWREYMESHGVSVFAPDYARNFMGPLDQQPPEICVAADTRFDNEAVRVRSLHGFNIEIVRPDNELDDGDQHRSEAGISSELIDAVIFNDGSLDELRENVRSWCDFNLGQRYPRLESI